jgi:membrane-bound metal-dependent hydrolase YbcI (DUF457 family)
MPNYKGHLAGAVAFYACVMIGILFLHLTSPDIVQSLFFTCLGALFPDIDTKSKGQKFFYLLFACTALLLFFKGQYSVLLGLSAFAFLPLVVNHRGLFHSFWFLAFVTTGILFILTSMFPANASVVLVNGAFFFLGIISHLILDFGIVRAFRR